MRKPGHISLISSQDTAPVPTSRLWHHAVSSAEWGLSLCASSCHSPCALHKVTDQRMEIKAAYSLVLSLRIWPYEKKPNPSLKISDELLAFPPLIYSRRELQICLLKTTAALCLIAAIQNVQISINDIHITSKQKGTIMP